MKMFKDEYQSVCNAAKGKLGLLEKSPLGYFVSSIVAGMFIALGGFVTFTLGAHLTGQVVRLPSRSWLSHLPRH